MNCSDCLHNSGDTKYRSHYMQRKQARDFLPYSRYGILGKYICSFLDLLKGFGLCEIFAHLTPVG